MRAILLNDCSAYHIGSRTVTASLLRLARTQGISIDVFDDLSAAARPPDHDLLIVNGEGTFHHDAPRALKLHETVMRFKEQGAPAILLNAVVQQINLDFSLYDRVVVRESLSARYLTSRHPELRVEVIPDLAFCHPVRRFPRPRRKGIMFIDSVDERWVRVLDGHAAAHGAGALRLCTWRSSADELIQLMRGMELVVTGRFHGAVFAMLSRTPLIATPSNSWKTLGMMEDFGLSSHFCANHEDLARMLAAAIPPAASIPTEDITAKWRSFFASLGQPRPGSSLSLVLPPAVAIAPPVVAAGSSCVLVGNGPSVLSGQGKLIDQFDEVVRFNHFTTEGLEEHTGKKTTIWATFGKGMLPQDSQRPDKVIFVHGNTGHPAYTPGSLWRIPAGFYQARRKEIQAASKVPEDRRGSLSPSSGFLVASWLLDQGVDRISLVGFDHFGKERSKQHHYWNTRSFGKPLEHDGDAEAALLSAWVTSGRVCYLV